MTHNAFFPFSIRLLTKITGNSINLFPVFYSVTIIAPGISAIPGAIPLSSCQKPGVQNKLTARHKSRPVARYILYCLHNIFRLDPWSL